MQCALCKNRFYKVHENNYAKYTSAAADCTCDERRRANTIHRVILLSYIYVSIGKYE